MFLKEHSYLEGFIGFLRKFCVSPSKELLLDVVFPVCPPTLMKLLSRLSPSHISVISALALAHPMFTESCCKACLCNPFICLFYLFSGLSVVKVRCPFFPQPVLVVVFHNAQLVAIFEAGKAAFCSCASLFLQLLLSEHLVWWCREHSWNPQSFTFLLASCFGCFPVFPL